MKKVGLDIDGVCCNFVEGFYNFFNKQYEPYENWEDPFIRKNFEKIINDDYFWLDLNPLIDPSAINFKVSCYITARPIKSHISYLWLTKNGFPDRPVFSTGELARIHNPKVDVINALGLDYFVDDKPQHFLEVNKHCPNTTCFLMDAIYNREIEDNGLRITSLSEIKERIS